MHEKVTDEEIKNFYEDTNSPNHNSLKGRICHRPKREPLFGDKFRGHMIARLEDDTNHELAVKTYHAFEQEVVTHVANLIKDSISSLFSKIKRGR